MMSVPKREVHDEFATYLYEGVYLNTAILRSTMDDLKTLPIRQDDVFIVTFPKTGRCSSSSRFKLGCYVV